LFISADMFFFYYTYVSISSCKHVLFLKYHIEIIIIKALFWGMQIISVSIQLKWLLASGLPWYCNGVDGERTSVGLLGIFVNDLQSIAKSGRSSGTNDQHWWIISYEEKERKKERKNKFVFDWNIRIDLLEILWHFYEYVHCLMVVWESCLLAKWYILVVV